MSNLYLVVTDTWYQGIPKFLVLSEVLVFEKAGVGATLQHGIMALLEISLLIRKAEQSHRYTLSQRLIFTPQNIYHCAD